MISLKRSAVPAPTSYCFRSLIDGEDDDESDVIRELNSKGEDNGIPALLFIGFGAFQALCPISRTDLGRVDRASFEEEDEIVLCG